MTAAEAAGGVRTSRTTAGARVDGIPGRTMLSQAAGTGNGRERGPFGLDEYLDAKAIL